MKIQVLISTINKKFEEIPQNTQKYPYLTVINQVPNQLNAAIEEKSINGTQWLNYDEKGLSKSRNIAIELAEADIIYLTDDDVVLENKFEKIIMDAFKENPQCDILAFNVKGIEEEFKKEITEEKNLNYLTSMKLSSVQLVLKRKFLIENNLRYDELFGAGAKYQMGEENIFLFDALKKGANIKFIPKTIARLHIGESTWFEGFNHKYLFDKGASFWRMFGIITPLYSLTYCFRKRNQYKENLSFFEAYRQTINGMISYLKESK